MADEQTTTDGSESFVVHESDGQETAAAEGSVGISPEPTPEPESADDEADAVEEPDGDEAAAEDTTAGELGGEPDENEEDADTTADDEGGAASDDEDDEPKKKISAKKRIGQLTRARRDAERATETQREANVALQARLDALEKKLTPDDGDDKDSTTGASKAVEDTGEPDPEKFTYGDMDPAYNKALSKWHVAQLYAENEAKQEKTRQTEAAEQHAQKVQKNYDDKIVAGVEAYDDFEKVVVDGAGDQAKGIAPKYDLSPDFAMMALDSPVGHHVVYEVARDPKYSRKLAKMTPLQQAQEFGRLAAQYTSKDAKSPKKNKATSATPPPTAKVNGSGVHRKDAKDLDFAEFEKRANKEVYGVG